MAIIAATAAVGYGISRYFKIPVVAVLLVCGLVLGSLTEIPVEFLQSSMELGLAFLLFSMGIELSPERFANRSGTIFLMAITQISLVGLSAYGLAHLLGYDHNAGLLLSFAVASSSTLAVVRHLRNNGQMYEPFGRLVTGVLLIQDTIMLALLAFLPEGNDLHYFETGIYILLLGAASSLMHVIIVPFLVKKFAEDDEILLLLALAVLFIFLGMAHGLGLPLHLGAFAGGIALSAFPVNGLVRGQLFSVTHFFLAFFFVALGALIVFPSAGGLFTVLAFVILLFLITPPVVTFIGERSGISTRSSLESGLLLAQAGELSLAAALLFYQNGKIDPELFSIIALITVTTMTITPLLATDRTTYYMMHYRPGFRPGEEGPRLSGHILILGFGTVSRQILEMLKQTGREILIIDDDVQVVAQLRSQGLMAFAGDSRNNRQMLGTASLRSAHLVLSFARRLEDSIHVVRLARGGTAKVVVRVFDEPAAELIRKAGGIPINCLDSAVTEFINWFEGQTFSKPGSGLLPQSHPVQTA
ncbi:MAG: cation:proton antiporter [Spirochaetales bacterium]|nr:cation:proton antiporter [Spirochaetales bacterium]